MCKAQNESSFCAFSIIQLFHCHLLHIVLYSVIESGRSCDGSILHSIGTHVAIVSVITDYICMVTHTASYLSAILASYC